jgi:hypothetical protein
MKLSTYLRDHKISLGDFAGMVGLDKHGARTVNRWALGERIPRPATLARITAVTNGAVTPNDFFAPPAEPAEPTQPASAA